MRVGKVQISEYQCIVYFLNLSYYFFKIINLNCLHFSETSETLSKEEILPSYIQMVICIMERVLNFLPLKHHFIPLQVSIIMHNKLPICKDNVFTII